MPNWGINPLRDLSHVQNGDLLEAFQRKISHKGYQLAECKSPKVKARMEELWEAVFQCKLPESGFMPESFTRAVVSKVIYSTNIDWAKLACAKWRAKSRPAKLYRYSEGGEHLTYTKVILGKLGFDADDVGEEILELDQKRERLEITVQETRQLPEVVMKADRCKEIYTELKKLKKKLHRLKVDLKHIKKMAAFSATNPDCSEESEEWRQRVTKNEECLDTLIIQIQKLDEINQRENSEVLNAMGAIKDVRRRFVDAKDRLGLIQYQIEVHSRTSRRPQSITPNPIIADLQEDDEDGCLKPCSLCGRGFSRRDLIMASCGCHYHPWCIVTQTWNSGLCNEETCRQAFLEKWRRSMGLYSIEGK